MVWFNDQKSEYELVLNVSLSIKVKTWYITSWFGAIRSKKPMMRLEQRNSAIPKICRSHKNRWYHLNVTKQWD